MTSPALLLYDYCLNFSREIEFFWSQKFSWAACLYYISRYSGMMTAIGMPLTMIAQYDATEAVSITLLIVFPCANASISYVAVRSYRSYISI